MPNNRCQSTIVSNIREYCSLAPITILETKMCPEMDDKHKKHVHSAKEPYQKYQNTVFIVGKNLMHNKTFNKSFITISLGLVAMIIASSMFYFDAKSYISYSLFTIGFILVGIGILLGFLKMVTEK